MRIALITLALLAGLCVQAVNAGERVLVLVGSGRYKDSHSQFLQGLQDNGLAVDIKGVNDKDLQLKDFDNFLYDSLVLLAPKATKFGGDISSQAIVDFVDSGKNLVLAASSDASDAIRSLALECGVELDDKGTEVNDHFNHQADRGAHDSALIATTAVVDSPAIFGSQPPKAPVLFKGLAAAVPASSELVTVALSAEATAYSHDPSKPLLDPPTLPVGGSAALVSLVQARNNARVLVAGSLDLFSDKLFDAPVKVAATGKSHPKSGNKEFVLAVVLWTLQQRGVLSLGSLTHHLVTDPPGASSPALYRVNDEVEVSLQVHLKEDGRTTPYK
eukprot:GHRR01027016.1.p1 GENE.GHRR01027016.1~~GHRR01027016.1.p1  ORF type:complete len:331 (+),score=101.31 GHRR01027016.1:89-1081(+)